LCQNPLNDLPSFTEFALDGVEQILLIDELLASLERLQAAVLHHIHNISSGGRHEVAFWQLPSGN
jgi:hypothetical protein